MSKAGNFLSSNPGALAATAVTLGDMMGSSGSEQPSSSTPSTAQSTDPNLTRRLAISPLSRTRLPNLGNNYYAYGKMPEQSFYADNSLAQQEDGPQGKFLSQNVLDNLPQAVQPIQAAEGGPLSRYVQGGGTGRSDSIDAKLSDGEYVIDAETVALLGDGSSKAGAQKLDQFRANIRKQKGKALAQGKISPDAHDAERYMMGGRA
jgi:hypothetical protein